MRGEKSRRGRRSTTKKGRTAVWDIGHRRSLLHRWGRLSPARLCWLRRPQPQTRSRKVSYDLVREERGQVTVFIENQSRESIGDISPLELRYKYFLLLSVRRRENTFLFWSLGYIT